MPALSSLRTAVLVTPLAVVVACSSGRVEHGPFIGLGGQDGSSTNVATTTGFPRTDTSPPAADAGGLCGNQFHRVVTDPPNVYFVLDASGSMNVGTSLDTTRYAVVQSAVTAQVKKLGNLIKAGAAVFPSGATQLNPCPVGKSIVTPAVNNATVFNEATRSIRPQGGTPVSATLTALRPMLSGLSGKTIVVLATDGAPNCNSEANCGVDDCSWNVDDACSDWVGMTCCQDGANCCVAVSPPYPSSGPLDCIDRPASVAAIKALADVGIAVHVIGIPGSAKYSSVLNEMAKAGGATNEYYRVDDLSTLGTALSAIAGSALSCDVTVDDPPSDLSLTNVYLDNRLISYDADNGWSWTPPAIVTLHGSACSSLKSGAVGQVQVVSGCPTEVAR